MKKAKERKPDACHMKKLSVCLSVGPSLLRSPWLTDLSGLFMYLRVIGGW